MPGKTGLDKKEKKAKSILKIYELLGKHKQIVVVSLDNVGSLQVQQVRREISRNKGLLLIGKNTIINKAVELRLQKLPDGAEYDKYRNFGPPIPELEAFQEVLKNKVGFIFTDQPVSEVKNIVEANKVPAAARVGIIAPLDVSIPTGSTGMDPSQISFFHALQISTKIDKGQIAITKDYQVCVKGRKIGNSEVVLLHKMNIKPFTYQMNVLSAYDSGSILDQEICQLSNKDIIAKFQAGVKNLTALSLQTGIVTELSIPHSIVNAFKNLAAIGLQVDYKFKQIANAGSAPPQQQQVKLDSKKSSDKPEVKVPVVEVKKEEPEDDVDMGGLFDF